MHIVYFYLSITLSLIYSWGHWEWKPRDLLKKIQLGSDGLDLNHRLFGGKASATSLWHLQDSFQSNPQGTHSHSGFGHCVSMPLYLLNFPQIPRMCVSLKSNPDIQQNVSRHGRSEGSAYPGPSKPQASSPVDICQPSSLLPKEQIRWWLCSCSHRWQCHVHDAVLPSR